MADANLIFEGGVCLEIRITSVQVFHCSFRFLLLALNERIFEGLLRDRLFRNSFFAGRNQPSWIDLLLLSLGQITDRSFAGLLK